MVFGREPIPGAVKTRLAAGVGEEAAALVYLELLRHTLEVAASVDADVLLALAEPPARGFRPLLEVAVEIQAAGDLGCRLADAFGRRFSEGYERVVVIGSDCPGLRPRHLDAALAGLAERPAALGPTADGGYWSIGLCRPAPGLFERMPWSTAHVLEDTRRRLRALGIDWLELETLRDLDTAADLEWALEAASSEDLGRRLRHALESVHAGGAW